MTESEFLKAAADIMCEGWDDEEKASLSVEGIIGELMKFPPPNDQRPDLIYDGVDITPSRWSDIWDTLPRPLTQNEMRDALEAISQEM